MQLWALWLDTLDAILASAVTTVGLGSGVGIILVTLLLRLSLAPLSGTVAYRSALRRHQLTRLKPEIDSLQSAYRDRPEELFRRLGELYAKNGLKMFDVSALAGAIFQMPIVIGMFQILRSGTVQSAFLWIRSLARPDIFIALLAGSSMALLMMTNPDLPEQMRMVMIVLPAVLTIIFALKFASGLALYWIVSNAFAVFQSLIVNALVKRQLRATA